MRRKEEEESVKEEGMRSKGGDGRRRVFRGRRWEEEMRR